MRWDQFKKDIQAKQEKERDERIADWEAHQEVLETERARARAIEQEQSAPDIPRKLTTASVFANNPPSANIVSKTSADDYFDTSPPLKTLGLIQPPKLDRIRKVLAGRTNKDGNDFPDAGKVIEHQIDEKSVLFSVPPVQVFSVRITPPSPDRDIPRPPTPFPMTNTLSSRSISLPGSTFDVAMDVQVATNDYEDADNEPPPQYHLSPPSAAVLPSVRPGNETNLPRLAFATPRVNEPLKNDEIPSPSDTEPIEHYMLPPRRRLPRPPVFLRPDHYRDTNDEFMDGHPSYPLSELDPVPCFEPHIAGINRERVLYPFTETGRPGPRTDHSMSIKDRIYYPYADLDIHYNIARTERLIMVNTRTNTVISGQDNIPAGSSVIYTVLAPRNANYNLVLPGLLWPNNFGPLDLPHVAARTLGERYQGLCQLRRSIMNFIQQVRQLLTPWQITEAESPYFALFSLHGIQLVETRVNRAMFFRIIHPCYNPLITRIEAVFLRGACYIFQRFQQLHLAETVDLLLRSPQLDVYMCRELLELGCLDRNGKDDEAYRFLEDYEDMAQGDSFFNL
jgi:hypothetical protein